MRTSQANSLMICPECDALYSWRTLAEGETAQCLLCDCVLGRHYAHDIDRVLALGLACAIFFMVASVMPVLSVELGGMRTEVTLWNATLALKHGWISLAAVALALTTFLIPMAQILALLWIALFAKAGRRPPGFTELMTVLRELKSWSMTEVFLLGALVAVVKLSSWVPIEIGSGIWSLAALTLLFALLGKVDPQYWLMLGEPRLP